MLAPMGALKDLWQSERGLVAIALIAATTVMTFTGRMTVEQWLEYTKWIFAMYAAAKTVTGAVAMATAAPGDTTAPKWVATKTVVGEISVASVPAPVPTSTTDTIKEP